MALKMIINSVKESKCRVNSMSYLETNEYRLTPVVCPVKKQPIAIVRNGEHVSVMAVSLLNFDTPTVMASEIADAVRFNLIHEFGAHGAAVFQQMPEWERNKNIIDVVRYDLVSANRKTLLTVIESGCRIGENCVQVHGLYYSFDFSTYFGEMFKRAGEANDDVEHVIFYRNLATVLINQL